jgi:hypothetical protein
VNWETAFELVNAAFLAKEGRQLRDSEVTIFQGTWLGLTYEQMAETSEYSLNYLMRDVGPKFWRLLSKVLDEKVGKTTIRVVLEKFYRSSNLATIRDVQASSTQELLKQDTIEASKLQSSSQFSPELPLDREHSDIVDASIFYGRGAELATLKQWILENRCRLTGLSGLSGIGKTILLRML